ncbi:clusterin-associated protein 1 [Leptopilina heterotoma]|uniref:clusterin-associated protein 1 n=1 Tax=Leptopilina heterotoma TaxID=63436 RepID=UPI001CA953D4|nr:clusterin-associated protein 1 [Leptopilina heterotoma]
MSFRDLRNFTEMLRVLGYPRLVSLSNFRSPNFPLVAEILVWLVKRFDPDSNISSDYATEQDRVILIRQVAEFMAITANIKLNTKKLYQADGYAVQELLKVTQLLYEAQLKSSETSTRTETFHDLKFDISDKINELKTTRQLASELTTNGATLFDLLGREAELREIRNSKVSRQFDTSEIEMALKETIDNTKKEIEDTRKQINNVKETEQNLDAKIERRRTELDRNQKRLQTLKKVKPAFMGEFERLEVELKSLYEDYLQKFRYLAYLEHLQEDTTKVEQERFERRQAATKKQLEQLRAEDVSFETLLEGNDSIFTNNLQDPLALGEMEKRVPENTARETGRASKMRIQHRRIYGSMSGRQRGVVLEANESDSDSDLYIDGDLDDEDDDDNDDDDILLNSVHPTGITEFDLKPNQEKRAVSKIDHSDEDF